MATITWAAISWACTPALPRDFNSYEEFFEAYKKQIKNLIRAYFNMDGHHIQFNVIDRKTLLAAQANPEEYKDLIVRVAGYSDHFRNLSKELQNEIINRTEQSFDDYSDADSEYPKGGWGCKRNASEALPHVYASDTIV